MKVSFRRKKSAGYYPQYVGKGNWAVDTENGVEKGDLLYVLDRFCHDGLHYSFNTGDYPDQPNHAHSFEEVLEAVIDDPENFSIENFLEQYSVQERAFLYNLRDLLILAKKEKRVFTQEETAPRGPQYYQRELQWEKNRN